MQRGQGSCDKIFAPETRVGRCLEAVSDGVSLEPASVQGAGLARIGIEALDE